MSALMVPQASFGSNVSGALHQFVRGDTVLLDRAAIEFAHLRGGIEATGKSIHRHSIGGRSPAGRYNFAPHPTDLP